REVAPRLEPRVLAGSSVTVEDWSGFVAACLSRGLTIAATSPSLMSAPGSTPELRGLLYVARPSATQELTEMTIAPAAGLSPFTKALPALKPGGHEFSRFYQRRFARAYAGAAEALRRGGAASLAARADSVADAINRGDPRVERARLLDEFVAGLAGLRTQSR